MPAGLVLSLGTTNEWLVKDNCLWSELLADERVNITTNKRRSVLRCRRRKLFTSTDFVLSAQGFTLGSEQWESFLCHLQDASYFHIVKTVGFSETKITTKRFRVTNEDKQTSEQGRVRLSWSQSQSLQPHPPHPRKWCSFRGFFRAPDTCP